jgi:hypothetical protein
LFIYARECESKSRRRVKIGHSTTLISLASLVSLASLALASTALPLPSATTLERSEFIAAAILAGKRLSCIICQILAINTCHLKGRLITKGNVRGIKISSATTLIPLSLALTPALTTALPLLTTALSLNHSTYHSLFYRKEQ